jgi:fatty-acyl-CoA synthase
VDTTPNYQLLIKHILQTPAIRNPNQEIVYKDKLRFTYKKLHQRVAQVANLLTKMGIKKGDTVAVMDYDSHRYLELYFAIPMLGAILHTINVRLSSEQILYTIDHAGDDILILHSDFLPTVELIKGKIDTVKEYILINEDDIQVDSSLKFYGEYEALLKNQKKEFNFPDFDENTIATTFYTTGTTGFPKGVYFSHRQLLLHTLGSLSSLNASIEQGSFHANDVYMPITPMFHVHAWGLPYVATMLGVKQVYPGKYIPELLLDLIQKEGVTFSHCVPTILHMLLASPKIQKMDLSGWKVMIGGATLPKAMCKQILELGIDAFTGYGMSETCPILSVAKLSKEELELGIQEQTELRVKTGKPLALVETKIVDENMNEVLKDAQATGEIVVRAPWLTQGYFKDEKNSQALWRGGYLHTGDVANIDEKGFIKITDRTKDVIKVGGEWISSLELEDIIHQHPSISEVAVIAVEDDRWGERPLALVVLKQESTEKEILRFTKEFIKKGIMARESMLLKVQIVENLDKTSVGKINKRVLRQKYTKV